MPKQNDRVEESSKELVLSQGNPFSLDNLSEDELREFKIDAGKGVSQRPEDNIIPTIRVLQANSPECNVQHPRFIMGAEPGAFLYRSGHPFVIPPTGFDFVPSMMEIKYLEFRPRRLGGGFVASHKEMPSDAKLTIDPETERKFFKLPNSNEVAEYRFRSGLLVHPIRGPLSSVISFTGAQHTDCRAWEANMNEYTLPGSIKAPAWIACYHLATRPKTNAKGTWFGFDIQPVRRTSSEERNLARQLFEAFATGKVTVNEAEVAASRQEDDSLDKDIPF